jgi:MFS family permease
MQSSDPPQPAGAAGRLHYGFIVLGLVILVVFSALGLARFGYTSVLPAMQEALRLSNTQTGVLQSWNLVGYLVTVVFSGFLAARFGPRVVIAAGLLIVAAGMALTGLVPTFGAAGVGRFLAGVGGASSNVPAMALLSAWFGARRRGLASGAGVGGSSVALIVTGPLIPVILQRYGADGWRASWYVLAALTLLVFAAAALFLRNRPAEKGLRPIGESEVERNSSPASAASALNWGSVYRSGQLWKLAGIYFGFGFSYIIYSTFFVRYLTGEAGYTRAGAGALWMQVGMISLVSGFLWGGVSDRWGRRAALLWVFGLQGASFLLFGLGREGWNIYLSAALFAVTAWSVPALMAALCGDWFGGRLAPAALGLITLVFGLGQALGPWLAGAIADATHSFGPAFQLAGAVALLVGGGGSLLFLGGISRRPDSGKMSGRAEPKFEALLLLGPTGSGKTPLGSWLEQNSSGGRRCYHFDFGANLRAVVAGETAGAFTAGEIRFLRRVLEEGALLEDEQFPLAARILDGFIARRNVQPNDRLILNGLPRHLAQAQALERKLTVRGVIQLDCDAPTVAGRLRCNTGGDRAQRTDDTNALVARKLAIFHERTRPLLDYYQRQSVPVLRLTVEVGSQPPELARAIEQWLAGV